MNFKEALEGIKLVLESKAVPLLVGESGIGKTSLVKKLSKDEEYYYINIDGNLLKEGEIGGLPVVQDYGDEKSLIKKTVYAAYYKFIKIDEILKNNPNQKVLLFIDEINRCEHSVQQEIMNIILNREINGYKLKDNITVIAAMNPSSKYDEFEESDYQVNDMDPAQEDRFVWIYLESDVNNWIEWGHERINGESRIHEDILGFIASFPEYLSTPNSKESIKATPRSWERVSNIYKAYIKKKTKVSRNIFYNLIRGNVGTSIAQDFINYIDESKSPLLTPEDIFANDCISEDIKDRIRKESHSRLFLSAKNILFYLENKEDRSREVEIFSEFLSLYPNDLKLGIMQNIKSDSSKKLYKEFLENTSFLENFFLMYEGIED
ncbi:MoxR-like ATPase [Clostridium acetobutylicum]|uniref:MoxR-like ATPase n=1 Tax=Clostridium acetobutylicum (strain ATCC 824 / DSM 792 / JCM 1419 / IAM 19013 / LMG 5710 / NBRC 13948 / NRRL B-527 / VKM B-1787 / 2291 / W) TaxID=272562 RepID=Q97HZ8_CLOAB|nr:MULTISPECIES: MoxR family ATPase [Clostridium]AAK79822.1 MoxR-like ATPase [Clostridium acetobutylicum ATCC 824]ADZ20908.1 MoxR-like ATPase [Clostridium acetobutylicum EA 2018]AEI32002.1 MoxR-like ATPase [Clostridium acetobutylicum DSM 1731]AWV79746.1 MoxR family ATPase [Clostridium acetobutylicum]MBC2394275.1 MoxR family ATPase [Clostridium acetobutylicum]